MFVPRSVKTKPQASKPTSPAAKSTKGKDHGTLLDENGSAVTVAKGKEQEEAPVAGDEKDVQAKRELATLVELSLTDYALWRTPELRQIVETQPEGWLSFETLIRHASLLQNVEASPNDLAQALRVHGNRRLELRLSLTKRSTRSGAMFDIRRKDWEDLRDQSLRDMSEEEWNATTIYVENIPPQHYKTKHEIVLFLETCLGDLSEPIVVQDLSFPPKEGREGNDTKCRGFAFVVCNSSNVSEKATERWSWTGVKARFQESLDEESMQVDAEGKPNGSRDKIRLAKHCGFRVITYQRWTKLRDEYLAHRDVLIAKLNARPEPEIAASSSSRISPNTNTGLADKGPQPQLPGEGASAATNNIGPKQRVDYPQGCVVFVRNVHPGTNKTTLKKLLCLPFTKKRHDGSELDYVDWTRGLDSCYVRLSSSAHADRMVHYFSKYVQCQHEPSDHEVTRFVTPEMFKKRIAAELVEGEREMIYWRNVPQKIKQDALAKNRNMEQNLPQAEEAKPPRKRRKV